MKAGRGPAKRASAIAVRDRVRRLPCNTVYRREAKRLIREDPDKTLAALQLLMEGGDVTQAHIDAHLSWMAEQDDT